MATGLAPAKASVTQPSATHAGAEKAHATDIRIAAVFHYRASHDPTEGMINGAVHTVVRIPGATAVFYSLGGPGDSSDGVMPSIGLSTPYNPFSAWSVGIIDTKHLKYYLPLSPAHGKCLCSRVGDVSDLPAPKTPLVGWAVLPPLPKDLTSVTIRFAFGTLIPNVPVTAHLPRPAVASGWQNTGLETTRIPLGKGWPKLPPASIIAAADKSQSIRSLATNTADQKESTKETATTSSISVDSNVLFAFNESKLTPQAKNVLADIASRLSKAGAGTATIVGYTDDIGDDASNLALSQARAQSVLTALSALVTDSSIALTASGMGEKDPVADNATPEGRQLNRRVTITFAKAGKR